MKQNYLMGFRKKIARLREEAGRTYPSLAEEYEVSKNEHQKLLPGVGRSAEGNSVSKKSGGILCGGNWLEAYRFIDENRDEFWTRWLLRRLKIYPNEYYNYRKRRKKAYYARKNKSKSR